MMKLRLTLLIFCFIGLISCSEEQQPSQRMTVSSFTPESGLPGQEVIITGQNLSEVNKVMLGATEVSIIDSPTKNDLRIVIPENGSTDFFKLMSPTDEIYSNKKFSVLLKPTIANVSPLTVGVNESITITGANFAVGLEVRINGHNLPIVSVSSTTIVAKASPGTTSGVVDVVTSGFMISSNESIVFLPHLISIIKSNFNENEITGAGAGYVLKIIGNLFSEERNEVTVTFNGVAATEYQPYKTYIHATIPSNATSGPLVVKIGNVEVQTDFNIYTGVWRRTTDFPDATRQNASVFSIGNKAYMCTGVGNNGVINEVWEFDSSNSQWTRKADFPGDARQGAASFSINGKGYLGTGIKPGLALNDFWEYDPVTDQWTQKASFPGVARANANGFAIGGFGYLGNGPRNDFYKYDPIVNEWTQITNYPEAAASFAEAVVIQSKAYIGMVGSTKFWQYDPALNQWFEKASIPSVSTGGFSFALDQRGYFGGGDSFEDNVWEYTPETDSWKAVANVLGNSKSRAISFGINGKGYAGVSGNGGAIDLWTFEP